MDKELYFGVDVSKKTLDVAYYDGEKLDWKNGHIRVDNNDSGFKKIGSWIKRLGLSNSQCVFCMEYTGLYNQNFRQWLERVGIVYGMVNGRKMHHFEPDLDEGERALERVKSDEMDSFRIAIYCEQNSRKIRRSPSRLPSETYFKLKRLIAERKQDVRHSVLYKQQLNDISVYDTEKSRARKKESLAALEKSRLAVDEEIDNLMDEDPMIRKNYDLLLSIKGIGRVVALDTIVLTENFTAITDPRKYACYIGIAPFPRQSGTSVRSAPHVTKKGFSQAKANLSMACIPAVTFDAELKAYYKRRKEEGKRGGIVLNAVKFKLVLRMFAVVRRQTPYVDIDKYKQVRRTKTLTCPTGQQKD